MVERSLRQYTVSADSYVRIRFPSRAYCSWWKAWVNQIHHLYMVYLPRAQLTPWPKGHVPWTPRLGGPLASVGQNDKCKSKNNQLLKWNAIWKSNLIWPEIFHKNGDTLWKKYDLRPLYFAQKCAQNAGNGVSETRISKMFSGCMPLDSPIGLCRHFCKLGPSTFSVPYGLVLLNWALYLPGRGFFFCNINVLRPNQIPEMRNNSISCSAFTDD